MKRHFLYIFLLFFITGFLVLPNIAFAELNLEQMIENQDKIELKKGEVKEILRTITQGLTSHWVNITTSNDFILEEQVISAIISEGAQVNTLEYLLTTIGKDTIEITLKLASLLLTQDPSIIIGEIEKITVQEAKEYALDWLLQKEIKVGRGNLKFSYPAYIGGWEQGVFPYIIVYRPLDLKNGEVIIEIYSSKTIKTPASSPRFQWEGGIDELPPFIVRIEGRVEKFGWVSYRWTEGPEIEIIFDEPVPEFEFKEPTLWDRFKSFVNEIEVISKGIFGSGVERFREIVEKAEDVYGIIVSFFSGLNLFGASVAPAPQFFEPVFVPDEVSLDKEEIEEIEEIIEEIWTETRVSSEIDEIDIDEFQDMIDDIAERIDILSQKIKELLAEEAFDGIGGPIEELGLPSYAEATEGKEEEIEESKEEPKEVIRSGSGGVVGGGGGQQKQPKITLSYSENNPVDKEIEAVLSLADFKNVLYDVKISIEKEDVVLSQIYSQKEDKWQSSHYYLKEVFSGSSFEGSFRLKIAEEKNDFRGEADIIVRVRESAKTNYSEFIDKINLTEPEFEPEPEPEPQPILEVFPESLEFSIIESATPSQSQAFTISNSGEGDLEWESIIEYVSPSDANWLKIEPDSGTAPFDVLVSLTQEASGLAVGNYAAEIVITAEGAEASPQIVEVGLDIEQGGEEEKEEPGPEPESEEPSQVIVINEIAWMGTKASIWDEWIELYNNTEEDIDFEGWKLIIGEREVSLTGSILTNSFYLLERDEKATDISADLVYGGERLSNDGEKLALKNVSGVLIDKVDCPDEWFAGMAAPNYISMERINSEDSGLDPANWIDNDSFIAQQGLDAEGNLILGTPKALNSASFLGEIIYVDDDFEDDPGNHRWNTIQEGIDDAQEGWIVIVRDGIYRENIKIEKPNLVMRSEQGVGTTIIETADSDKDILQVLADNVEVRGFTFQKNSGYQKAGLYLSNVKNCIIKENKFLQNYIGIFLSSSTDNTLKNNIFEENRWGIYLENSQSNALIKNTVNSKRYSYKAITCGIYLNSSHSNSLIDNIANDKGISTSANAHGPSNGICLFSSNNNILENNTAQNNKGTGDGIYFQDSNNNTLKGNNVKDNQAGIVFFSSNNNNLDKNEANNNEIGINIIGSSTNNILINNSMTDNCIANFNISCDLLDSDNDIDITNLVDGNPIYYLKDQSDIVIDSSSNAGLIYCIDCQNITVKDLIIDSRNMTGIYLYKTNNSIVENTEISESVTAIVLEDSNNNFIEKNLIKKNFRGLNLFRSDKNKISDNIMEENDSQGVSPCFGTSPRFGVQLNESKENEISNNLIINNPIGISLVVSSRNNTLFNNTIENNKNGIEVYCSFSNLFYHNNFINNETNQWGSCVSGSPENQWYHPDLNQGNYYSDYDEPEEGCNDIDNDNICDDAYFPWNNDEYPFTQRDGWESP